MTEVCASHDFGTSIVCVLPKFSKVLLATQAQWSRIWLYIRLRFRIQG